MYNKILYLLDNKFVKSCKSNVVTNLQARQTARVQGICHQSLYFPRFLVGKKAKRIYNKIYSRNITKSKLKLATAGI